MFARTVALQLKPNSVAEFTQTIEKDIIPLLRKQPGFQDEIAFVVPGGTEAVSVSMWDDKTTAEAYARSTYPQVLKAVANVVAGGLGSSTPIRYSLPLAYRSPPAFTSPCDSR